MRAKSAEEIAGLEFDWLAHDMDGHVGLFSTAGGGYAPEEFLRDTGAFDEAIELILSLPGSTAARFAPEVAPGLTNTWRLAAERGLFAFDADASGGPYRLIAAPTAPVRVSDLPRVAGEVVSRLGFDLLRFATSSVLSKETLDAGKRSEERVTLQSAGEMNNQRFVWVFVGEEGSPGAVFSDAAIAESWIAKWALTGVLTKYHALIADGVVERSPGTGWTAPAKWCCRIDSKGIRHASDVFGAMTSKAAPPSPSQSSSDRIPHQK